MSKRLSRLTETEARKMLEGIRWPDGPVCPKCGSREATALKGKSTRPGLYKCRDCRKQFTVTVGTIFERSHIKLADWVYAFDRMCCSKKGVSALQISRELEVTYKTGWFICHRIREAMSDGPGILSGKVEVDETYVGGKPRRNTRVTGETGRGTAKAPVLALVERGGRAKSMVVTDVTGKTLKAAIRENVYRKSWIFTDDFKPYNNIADDFLGHVRVNHTAGQYTGPFEAGTNEVESYFAILKRGVYGTFHSVSKKHLGRYCYEFDFRWNHRKVSDLERTLAALKGSEGKRLTYRQPDRVS